MGSVHLGYQIQTDVLELFLKNPVTEQWLSADYEYQVIATTIAVALRDAIAEELGIASTEMGFGYRLDKDLETGHNRSVVQVFDLVSGGAGFVIAGVSNIAHLLHKALDKLDCQSNCENVCSHCLASQDSRVEQEELNRIEAREWLLQSQFASYLALPEVFQCIQGATYCSQSCLQFIRSSMNKLSGDISSRAIQIMLRGDMAEWDLAYPDFREKVLAWKMLDKFSVRLCIEQPDLLSEDCKRNLRLLNHFGVDIVALPGSVFNSNPPLIAQIYSNKHCVSLFSSEPSLSAPGNHWLHSEYACTLVTSRQAAPIQGIIIDTSVWESKVHTGSKVMEVTDALNGPIVSLCSRLQTLIEKNIPRLGVLIKNDEAVSINYSDRYLKSPWSLMLLSGFLYLFKSGSLRTVNIDTLEAAKSHSSRQINHDWKYQGDQEALLSQWLQSVIGCLPTIHIKDNSRDLLHARVITIDWLSGKQSKIALDQGMGYWKPRMPYFDDMRFDFEAQPNEQLEAMAEKFHLANMYNSCSWPTYITFTPDFHNSHS